MMKNFTSTLLLLFVLLCGSLSAQPVTYTAKDQVTSYDGVFLFGSNFGYNPPWQDEQLADIAAGNPAIGVDGVGVKTSRPSLPGWFQEEYGYDFRVNTFQHYEDLGLRDNVCIVGFPSDDQKDPTQHCPGIQSEMFANMYEPIWDGGANGTPYNDDNYYAAYLHKTVSMYQNQVKFWEIWNEPGFDYSGAHGWQSPGQPGNWWENDPDPCDYKLRAPIQHYVRTLRISWEIIKSIDPEAYVIVAGVGFESFLDAILRNTDNPVDGSVTPDFPHGGGAYFDVMGFHSYPHFDGTMKYWDNATQSFVYERHSDKAITGIQGRQSRYQAVLDNYGFDGVTYPKKEWIITEINSPRKQFQDFVGSPEYQRNFIIKSAITCMRTNIHAMHVYNLGERALFNEAIGEFDLFGLYEKLLGSQAYTQVKTDEGISYKSASDLLFGSEYDETRTNQMNLPATIDGGAFLDPDGNYTYVLWAKTTQDMSEAASATYSFPASLNVNYLEQRNWEFSNTFESTQVDPTSVALTGEPVFLTESILSTDVSSGCKPLDVNFSEQFAGTAASYNWTFQGGTPATSTDANPSVNFSDAGTFDVTLEVLDGSGNVIGTQTSFIVVTEAPTADFNYTLSGPIIVFENNSTLNADDYTWVFGDGTTSTEAEPTHVYSSNGNYTITLISSNGCGASTQTANISVNTSSNFQIPYNANTVLDPYDGPFRPGTNFGYNPPWTDQSLADIAAGNPSLGIKGVGVKASRPTYPGWFAEEYGYEFNVPTYEHYDNLGLEENVMIIGFPSPEQKDQAFYCNGIQSEMFANMYSDIWDGGANGTPYNDDNYLAAYLYKVVQIYGEDVRFWEIWNEPGFDYTGNMGWREPGDPAGNWWDQNPDPCDYKLRAPVMHYVRILRISYEIIKTLQPDDYLVVAGVGFPSFLDAILRNTDNPVDGSVTADYPNGGGAYFDVMGFHAYPHFDGTMRWWDNSIGGFHYERHSDQAITSITNRQDLYQQVLENYGYDGSTYPNKEWIITESNLPRREFQDFIGNEDAQINYMAKAVVTCYKQNIHQFHVYNLGEAEYFSAATREFDLMGMYQKLITNQPYTQVVNQEGISYKTVSDILFGTEYDEAKTNAMNLPGNIDGAAFQDAAGNYLYVLWAVTTEDQSEVASANYTFPGSFNISQLYKRQWDYSETSFEETISTTNVALTGRPIYLLENQTTIVLPTASFFTNSNVGCAPFTVNFQDMSHSNIDTWNWTISDAAGNSIFTSTDQSLSYTFNDVGNYSVVLEVANSAGSNITTQTIQVEGSLSGGFTYVVNGNTVEFTNTTVNGSHYSWDFGDNIFTDQENPGSHTYATDGLYNVGLTVSNSCDTNIISALIEIGMGSGMPPNADFATSTSGGCGPVSINYINLSTGGTSFMWTFPGGNPATSTDANPTVIYSTPGVYSATLDASNGSGTTTYTQNNIITVLGVPSTSYTYSLAASPTIVFANNSVNGVSFFWDFGDGNVSSEMNPTHTYAAGGVYDVTLTAANGCGSTSFSQILNIDGANLPPIALFAADNINTCAPDTINFMDQSTNATSWNWSFPGGNPSSSTDQNPSVIYTDAGSYSVTLSVANANGTDDLTYSSYITVQDVPTTDYTFVVQDSLVTFTNLSSNVISTSWNFMDGSFSTDVNPTHVFTQSGVYDVVLTSANGCGSTSATYSIEIVTGLGAGPTPAFTVDVTNGCAPVEVNFTDQSDGNPTAWNWTFPGGTPSTSTDQNPTVIYNSSGTFQVSLEAINANGANSITQTSLINVLTVPSTDYSFSIVNNEVTFNNLSSGAVSYSWNFGDGTFSTDENPSHIFTNAGTYEVVLTGANGCGSTNVTYFIEITTGSGTAPTSAFIADVFSGCAPVIVNYSDISTGDPTSWNWSFPGGTPATSMDQNPQVTYNAPGTYNVTLVAANAIGSNTSTQSSYITVGDVPTVMFSNNTTALTTTFNNTSTNATTYLWDFGDGNTSTNANPTHTYAMAGTYTVTLTATNDCGSVTMTSQVEAISAPVVSFTSDVVSGCTPLTVNFSDLSSTNTTSWSWSFPGANQTSSTDQNPIVTYSTPGIYDVTLVGTNAAGSNSITQTSYIIVDDVPNAAFGTNTSSLSATFNNTSTNATTYLWDFGDGNTSTDVDPSHTYAANGTYTVTLTATNDCGSVTTTQTITVMFSGSAPTASFSANATSGCAPFVVSFSDLSTGGATSWSWSFPGATPATSTDQNPTVTYSTPGTYDVELVVSNAGGSNTATQTSLIIVNTQPTADFSSAINGNIVSFTNNSTGATSYSWDFGDGNMSTDANPTHTYLTDGTYTVTLNSTNACGTVMTTTTVTVVTAPTVAFTADVTTGCAPLTVNFNDLSSSNVTSWSWDMPGATPATSTGQNPSVIYSTPGTYDVSLTASNASGNYTVTTMSMIVVETVPTPAFDVTQSGAVYSFTNNSTGATSYQWNFGDGNMSTDQNPTHTYLMSGTYTVELIATNACGSTTTTQMVTVEAAPIAGFVADTTFGCAPFTVQFTDESMNATAWAWQFDGGIPATSTNQNPSVVYNTAGTYPVSLTVTNSTGTDTETINSYILVQTVPTAGYSFSTDTTTVTFMNNSVGATSYLWTFGDGNMSTEANPMHTYAANGVYTVTLSVTNECGTATFDNSILIDYTSLNPIQFIEDFQLFPNPNRGQFTILLKGQPKDDLRMRLINVLGQRIYNEELDFTSGNLIRSFNFDYLSPGTYIVELQSDSQVLYKKIVIE